MTPSRITVVGGAHLDRRGRIAGPTNPAASNPGTWLEEAGGGGFNAARNLARLGHDVAMVTVAGGDPAAAHVETAAEEAGVDLCALTFLDRATPSYTAILEADGNLVIALADMALYDLMTPRRLRMRTIRDRLERSDLVLCDANLPAETIAELARMTAGCHIPLAAIAVSPAKVVRLHGSLADIGFVFMNEAEAKALTEKAAESPQDWPDILRASKLERGFITRGRDAAVGWTAKEAAVLTPPEIGTVGDVTGAGDGFAAGALHAFLNGGGLGAMMRTGAALARLAAQSPLSAPADLSSQRMQESIALVPQPQMLA